MLIRWRGGGPTAEKDGFEVHPRGSRGPLYNSGMVLKGWLVEGLRRGRSGTLRDQETLGHLRLWVDLARQQKRFQSET